MTNAIRDIWNSVTAFADFGYNQIDRVVKLFKKKQKTLIILFL